MNNFKIYKIKKVASTTAQFYSSLFDSQKNLHICLLREPVERFWSACKTMHPDITMFNEVKSDDNIVVPSNKEQIDLEKVVKDCLQMLKVPIVDSHFISQDYYIHGNKFDLVIDMKELDTYLISLYKSGIIFFYENTNADKLRSHMRSAFLQMYDEAEGKEPQEDTKEMRVVKKMLHMNKSPSEFDEAAYEILRRKENMFELENYYAKDFFIWNNKHLLLKDRKDYSLTF